MYNHTHTHTPVKRKTLLCECPAGRKTRRHRAHHYYQNTMVHNHQGNKAIWLSQCYIHTITHTDWLREHEQLNTQCQISRRYVNEWRVWLWKTSHKYKTLLAEQLFCWVSMTLYHGIKHQTVLQCDPWPRSVNCFHLLCAGNTAISNEIETHWNYTWITCRWNTDIWFVFTQLWRKHKSKGSMLLFWQLSMWNPT